jgi:hypothetical protein
MASYTILGSETVYDYTRRIYAERVKSFNETGRGTPDDAQGRYALSKLIFITLKKNPSIVSDTLPPDASYIEKIINNPHNPLEWAWQKTSQGTNKVLHKVAVNLDKPAQFLSDVGKALPWYVKPGAMVGFLVAAVIIPSLIGSLLKGYMQGKRGTKNANV